MSVPAFADLLERLVFTPGRNAKLALLRRWFDTQPDPERGLGLAALTEELVFTAAKPALVRDLVAARTDPVLLSLSHDYVGDFAETVALIWPERAGVNAPPPELAEVVERLEVTPKAELPALIAGWLDTLDASGRYALIKLLTGALRVGVSARLARVALAEWAGKPVEEIEEVWHGVAPPYVPLFRWLEGKGERPDPRDAPVFRPLMLAHPLEDADVAALDPSEWRAEWKWDGIRVQLTAGPGGRRIWSRGGEDVSGAFPEIAEAMDFHAVLDGELLVIRENGPGGGIVAPFADLQQRLNRKAVTPKMQRDFPVGVRLYDLLLDGNEDLRPLPFDERRRRLEAWMERVRPARMDLSAPIAFASFAQLARDPRRRPRRLHRGADAEARGQPLPRRPREGAVVEVEARPALGRRGDDVRAARPREALAPSTATTPSACGARTGRAARSWCRSARPIPATRTRSWSGSTAGYATTPSPASARCGRWRSRWCWR